MPSPVVCPVCKGRGMLAFGTAIQYCQCPLGRAKKKMWFDIPEDMRAEEEAVCPTLPDPPQWKGRDVA